MALGSTQPLTEISTRNRPGGKRRPGHKADNPHRHLWADCLENMGASTSDNPRGLHVLLQGQLYLFTGESKSDHSEERDITGIDILH
jgi:hypothetical protein